MGTSVSQFSRSVQFSSVAQSCPTLCDPMNRSTPGLPVHDHLPEFTQTHVHRVGDAIQPSNPLSSHVQLFVTPWTAAHQASLSITKSWSSHKLMSIELVMPPTISYSVIPFSSHLQSFPASEFFQMSQFFASGGQSIGAASSASFPPVNTQD